MPILINIFEVYNFGIALSLFLLLCCLVCSNTVGYSVIFYFLGQNVPKEFSFVFKKYEFYLLTLCRGGTVQNETKVVTGCRPKLLLTLVLKSLFVEGYRLY